VTAARFAAEGLAPRELRLPRGCAGVEQDSHPRETSREALARLTPVHPGGVQTAGNSCAVADGAAAVLLARGADAAPERALAWVRGSCVVGVSPDVMGSGPVPAIQGLLDRAGLRLEAIDRLEINEAQGAQLLAVQQALELDPARLNVHGGAIALGHPLAATGLRLAITLARQLRAEGLRYGVAAVCIGGGQGMAVLLENPGWRGR
jgi:acetyl-CoA C-acetyltransferase